MNILAIITEADLTPLCLDAAVKASRASPRASIEALHIIVEPDRLVATDDEVSLQRLRESREGKASDRAEGARRAFLLWNAGADDSVPKVQWREKQACEEEGVLAEAATADLIVVALGENLDSSDARYAALHDTGKPVLLVPPVWRKTGGTASFTHIAVGLSDSDIARRAIADALPWLKAAETVTALRIGTTDDPALGLATMLEEAGITAQKHVTEPTSAALGTQLAAEAAALGADLLVAGAYRHGRLTEWLLGGTTRHLIAAATIPLLLAH